jgi:type IV secretory pathway ATPase VirB11/archaellum biosynthesis ATPase
MDSKSDIKLDLKRKQVTFIETDTQLLIECVQYHNSVINNNKTNFNKTTTIKQITPLMKSKVS